MISSLTYLTRIATLAAALSRARYRDEPTEEIIEALCMATGDAGIPWDEPDL